MTARTDPEDRVEEGIGCEVALLAKHIGTLSRRIAGGLSQRVGPPEHFERSVDLAIEASLDLDGETAELQIERPAESLESRPGFAIASRQDGFHCPHDLLTFEVHRLESLRGVGVEIEQDEDHDRDTRERGEDEKGQ